MAQYIVPASSSNSSHNQSSFRDDPSGTNDISKFSELFTSDSVLELCNSFWVRSPSATKNVQPYLRGCKWSPDGTCCLCVVNHDGFHIMELPRDLYEGYPTRDRMITLLPAIIHVKESGLVYDFCWYPKMNSHYPETCSWISTKINSPIQMWDAYNGSLRCSYRGFNAVDEMEPAISVTFIDQGRRIVGGYKNCLRTFDVERPGREFLEHKIKSSASCFATHGNLLAVGSWNANIKLYSILDNGTHRSVGNFHAHKGGITHLQFTPDGTKLVSGARKDHNLCVWDVRYHRRPLNILKRNVSTNQRIYFDISTCGRYLVSGGTDGVVRVWDNKFTKWTEQFNVQDANQETATFRFQLHRDCCNSISIHPSRPILATGSGQFHFLDPVKVLESECDTGTNCEDDVTKDLQTASQGSSDKQKLADNADIPFTKVHKMDFGNDVNCNEQDDIRNICSDVQALDSSKEFTDKSPYEDILERSSLKINTLQSNSESPSEKKCEQSNEIISTTVKDVINREISMSIPVFDTCVNISASDLGDSYEEPPTKKAKLNIYEIPIEKKSLGSEPRIDIDDNESCVTKDSLLHTAKDCKLITEKQFLDSNSNQSSATDTVIKNNIDVQSPTELIKVDEADSVYINKSDSSRQENTHGNSESTALSVSDLYDKTNSCVLNIESKFPANTIISEIERIPSMSKVQNIEKSSDSKCILDSVLESDDDYNDINENKMKYSSYAENNLTFWWIAKTLETLT